MYYHFNQNNSGGSFDNNPTEGIGHHVIIEANNAAAANLIAEDIGLYFDGCSTGQDCSCCGDRWYRVSESNGTEKPEIYGQEVIEGIELFWTSEVYIHNHDRTITTIKCS